MNQQVFGQIVKWGLKSVGGLLANILLLTLWVDDIGLSPEVAIVPNFFLISAVGYTVTNRWIFPNGVTPTTVPGHIRQYAGMQTANLTGKLGNYVIYLLLLPVVDYRVGWVLGAIATFVITFLGNKLWWDRGSAVSESA